MADEAILKERGSQYGAFEDNAVCTRGMVKVFEDFAGRNPHIQSLTYEQKCAIYEGIHLTLHKIGRIACGVIKEDNFKDAENYLELAWRKVKDVNSGDAPK